MKKSRKVERVVKHLVDGKIIEFIETVFIPKDGGPNVVLRKVKVEDYVQ